MSTYRISQLAERTGVPASTLRYYESTGLLPADRSPAGYRLYGDAAVERLGFITTAKRLGLPLDEIAELLRTWETGACVQVKTELRPRLHARLAEADRLAADVADFATTLQAALAHLDALPDRSSRCDPNCGFLSLADGVGWREAPVACSLTRTDLDGRAERWHQVLAGADHRQVPDGVELTLPVERVAAVAELAAAEQECCPFFDFHLHLDGPRLRLRVRAPADAHEMLTALFAAPADRGGHP